MPLAVAEHLVRRMSARGDTVLDPMVGSGTTLVAARRLRRRGLGFDRDPLALLVAQCSIEPFRRERLDGLELKILERAKSFGWAGDGRLPSLGSRLPAEDKAFVRYWFPAQARRQLFALAAAIAEEPEGPERRLCWVVFSGLIIAKSAGASLALDLSRSRPHRCAEKPVVLPFAAWQRRFGSARAQLPFLDRRPAVASSVSLADARSLPLGDDEVDLALTSPPYLNAIDYLRGHKFSLVWMGYQLAALRELRGTMMGSERGLFARDGLPPVLEERLGATIAQDRRRAQRRRYLSDLVNLITEVRRVLRPGGLALLVLGPALIAAHGVDAVEVVGEISRNVGLRLVTGVARDLSAARRSLPPPSSMPLGRLDCRMQQEVLVALRK
jgi:DNA modification methylase